LADLIVGAPNSANINNDAYAGVSYVVFGKTSNSAIDLSAITSSASTGGFMISGINAEKSGISVSAAGDVNGDGLADLIVGATEAVSGNSSLYAVGKSYVVFGKSTSTVIQLSDVQFGTGGFVIDGVSSQQKFGTSVSAAGDINGDGLADLIVGAPGDNKATLATTSYVIFGSTTGVFSNTAVDQLGTSSADILTSTSTLGGGQTLVGGAGNDTLISGAGSDVLYGGAGNDTFVVTASMVAALQNTFGSGIYNTTQLARIDGGTGIDTLQLTGGANLNLTAVSNAGSTGGLGLSRITSVEIIDMSTDTKGNTTTLALKDVLDMAGMNVFNSTNTGSSSGTTGLASSVAMHQLMIWGTAADYVNLGVSSWTKATGTANTAITYTDINNTVHIMTAYTYNTSTVYAQLLIENAIVNSTIGGGAHVT